MSILIKGTNIEDLQRAMLMFSGHEIVELPDHGDLIDRDALWRKMTNAFEKRAEEANMAGDRVVCVSWHDAVHFIKDAPVVIPAERSEDETDSKEEEYIKLDGYYYNY